MWGDCGANAVQRRAAATDEDLQAQAWLPSCLTALLAEVRALSFQLSLCTARVNTVARVPSGKACLHLLP